MTQIRKKRRPRRPAPCCGPDVVALLEPRFFRALCDPNRIGILVRLAGCARPCTVSEIAECCPVNISVVSRHLATLREAGILDASRRGREVYYSVRVDTLVSTLRTIADAIARCCPAKKPGRKEKPS